MRGFYCSGVLHQTNIWCNSRKLAQKAENPKIAEGAERAIPEWHKLLRLFSFRWRKLLAGGDERETGAAFLRLVQAMRQRYAGIISAAAVCCELIRLWRGQSDSVVSGICCRSYTADRLTVAAFVDLLRRSGYIVATMTDSGIICTSFGLIPRE